ncbi:UNVERIFIED_CONTAM: hypothetical protein RMT77_002041 [Armadillidium vulgare]
MLPQKIAIFFCLLNASLCFMSFNKFPFISKSAKIGSFWSPIFDKFSEVFSTSSGAAETSGFEHLCIHPRTTYLEGKCLRLLKGPLAYDDAQMECMLIGGKLYQPNFENPFLFEYYRKFFPEIFDGLNETVLIGFRTKANGSIVNTNESIDVSKNPYFVYKKASFEPEGCVALSLGFGGVDPVNVNCSQTFSFACEFPSTTPDFVQNFW